MRILNSVLKEFPSLTKPRWVRVRVELWVTHMTLTQETRDCIITFETVYSATLVLFLNLTTEALMHWDKRRGAQAFACLHEIIKGGGLTRWSQIPQERLSMLTRDAKGYHGHLDKIA